MKHNIIEKEMSHFITRLQIVNDEKVVVHTVKYYKGTDEHRRVEKNIGNVLKCLDLGSNIDNLEHLLTIEKAGRESKTN